MRIVTMLSIKDFQQEMNINAPMHVRDMHAQ